MVKGSVELLQDAIMAGERSWRGKDRYEAVGRQSFPKSIREVRCYMCWQREHMKGDYPQRKKGKGEGFKSESSSAVAERDASDHLLMLLAECREEADRWVLDFASSYHCIPH